MHDLQPLNALGAADPKSESIGTVTLHENPNVALASVAARLGHESACEAELNTFIDATAPGAGKAALGATYDAIWVGPAQWMVCAPYETHEDIADRLKTKMSTRASVTEQSDAWVCFDLIGPGGNTVMERLCNIDIYSFETGDATRTSIDHLGCIVLRKNAREGLRIIGPRSSAGSLWHAITTAMRSVL